MVSHGQTHPFDLLAGATFSKAMKRRIIYISALTRRASFLPLRDFHTPTSLFYNFFFWFLDISAGGSARLLIIPRTVEQQKEMDSSIDRPVSYYLSTRPRGWQRGASAV